MQWTTEQQQVLDTQGKSQMVSAAAGSGKTAVMTEYVTRRVVAGLGLERLCVVTFTHAAAEQMRQKIAARLREAAEEEPRMRQELDKVEDAWISTVHALCRRIIRRYGAGAGLTVTGALLGEQEQANLWQEAFSEALSAGLQNRMSGLDLLIRLYGGRDGSDLLGPVSSLRALCHARPEGMALAQAMLKKTLETTPEAWNRLRQEDMLRRLDPIRELLRQALQTGSGAVPEESLAVLQDDLAQAEAGRVPDFFGRLSAKSKGFDPEAKARVKTLRDLAKALAGKITGRESLCDDLSPVFPALSALVALALDADARYAAAKEARGGMDFDDLEHGALKIVQNPAMVRELQEQFDLVLVDEYQDTNPVQEAILTAISRPDNLFTVGDVKQAIYRFRQADPGIFLARSALPDDENRVQRRLNANFRSSAPVVDFVNLVFSKVMTRAHGGVDYDEGQALAARAPYPAGEGEVSLLLAPPRSKDSDGELGELDDLALQVQAAARFIRQRVGSSVYDPKIGQYRTATYGDFAILLRKRRGRVAPVAQLLEECGIPAYATGGDWVEQPEIQETCDLLRLLDNRRRDMELLSCLHSAYGRMTMAELWQIRKAYPQNSFADAAELFAHGEGDPARRLREFLNRMDSWREDAAVLPPDELIDRILEESGYYCAVGAMSAGQNRQANLRLLTETAAHLAGSRNRGLYGLLRYLDEMAESGSRMNAVQTQGTAAQAVQIATIHGSKGLEYPIVLLLDMDGAMNIMPYRENVLQMDARLGFGCRTLTGGRLARSTAWKLLADKLRREDLSEEVRILYVALTRAMQQLVLVMNEPTEKQLGEWLLPPEQAIQMGDRYADWIMPVLLRCRGSEILSGQPQYPVSITVLNPPALNQAPPAPIVPPAGPPDEALLAQLSWRYPHITGLPAKRAATDGVGEPDLGMTRPGRSGRLSARERGILTHRVLEHLQGTPEETLSAMAAAGLIRPQDMAEVEIGWLRRWMAHPLYARMLQSPHVHHELPFTLQLPASQVMNTPADDPVMIQGIIDLAFMENGGWVLVDFKTGDVLPGWEKDYVRHYHPQLALYKKALVMLTGLPVYETGLYLLPNSKFVEDENA